METTPVSPERIARGLYWEHAWKIVEGCTHVSTGCDRCWSARETHARAAHPNVKISSPKQGLVEGGHFNGKIRLREDNLDKPLHRKKPTVYAVWNDLFHEDVPEVFIDKVLDTIASCPQHIFIILTKRPKNLIDKLFGGYTLKHSGDYPLKNCWFGVSVEDQKTADERIPYLFDKNFTWHNNKFVSYEPALAPIDFRQFLPRAMPPDHDGGTGYMTSGLDWIVMGGENGKGARPMSPDWARKTRDDCKAVGVPFFFKGGLLDGKEHKEMPR